VDVSAIAVGLGGGGHARAAGCTLRMSLDAAHAAVLAPVRAAMR
jgi:phosphoesterase RecJ-like protein